MRVKQEAVINARADYGEVAAQLAKQLEDKEAVWQRRNAALEAKLNEARALLTARESEIRGLQGRLVAAGEAEQRIEEADRRADNAERRAEDAERRAESIREQAARSTTRAMAASVRAAEERARARPATSHEQRSSEASSWSESIAPVSAARMPSVRARSAGRRQAWEANGAANTHAQEMMDVFRSSTVTNAGSTAGAEEADGGEIRAPVRSAWRR